MELTVEERLIEFYRRLEVCPPARSSVEAWDRICRVLDEVEDEFSGVAKKSPPPPRSQSDGRMYAPLEDSISRFADGRMMARTRRHSIELGNDGTITIRNRRTNRVEFHQRGGRTDNGEDR